MNRIIDWLRRLRLGNRHRRIEALGGHPGKVPSLTAEPFEPELNADRRIQGVRDKVRQMGAASFDEATGNFLATLINEEGQDCGHQLDQQHRAYLGRAGQLIQQAQGVVWQYAQLLSEDVARHRHAETAVESAVLGLSGYDSSDANERSGVVTVITGRPAGIPDLDPGGDDRSVPEDEPVAQSDGEVPADRHRLEKLDSMAILFPPRVSHSELRRLMDPQDANRVPQWGEPGFRDGALLGGRPRSTFIHVLALTLAAGADVGAFAQTVQLVLPQADWIVLLVVIGLTAVVLYIAHMIGVMLRESRAAGRRAVRGAGGSGGRLGRRLAVIACTLVWLAVGGLAFWVRYTVPLPVTPQVGGCGVIGSGPSAGCSTSGATNGHPLQAAAIFLGLYLATGVVAALGAYFTHNPHRGGYVSALRAYKKTSERVAASMHRYGMAQAAYVRQQVEIDHSAQILAKAHEQNTALTAQLKEIARIEIASMLKDPAVTDAFFP